MYYNVPVISCTVSGTIDVKGTSLPTGAIIGIAISAVGIVLVIIGILLVVLYLWCKKTSKQNGTCTCTLTKTHNE